MPKKSSKYSFKDKVNQMNEDRKKTQGGSTISLPDGISFFVPPQPKKGTTTKIAIDIIPFRIVKTIHERYQKDDLHFVFKYFYHRDIGAQETSLVCPTTFGLPCPICEEVKRLSKDWNANKEIIKSIRAKERELYNVIDLDSEEHVIQLWDISPFNFGELLTKETEENQDLQEFPSLDEGLTLKVRMEKKKLGDIEYLQADRIDFEEREHAYDDSILDESIDPATVLKLLSYKEIERLFLELPPEEGESEEGDDENDARRESRRKKNHVQEDEDEVEDTPWDRRQKSELEEEEDEFEPPKSRKTRHIEEDESGDDDEEEQPSVGPKRRKAQPAPEENEDDEPLAKVHKDKVSSGKKRRKADEDDFEESEECPVKGGQFGQDCDEYDECDECPIWENCRTKKDEIEEQAAKDKPSKQRKR